MRGRAREVAGTATGSVLAVAVRNGCAGSVLSVALGVACPCSDSCSRRDRKFSTIVLRDKISATAESLDRSFGFRFDFRRARGEEPGPCTPAPAFGGTASSVLATAAPVSCPCSGGCSLTRAPSSSLTVTCLGLGVLGLESAIGRPPSVARRPYWTRTNLGGGGGKWRGTCSAAKPSTRPERWEEIARPSDHSCWHP